jgi:hypothetical protein
VGGMINHLTIRDGELDAERDFFFEMQKYSCHLRADFIARQVAIGDLYRQTLHLPGSVLELGVRNGANLFYLARLMEVFGPAARRDPTCADRHIFGFDTFGGFPEISPQDEGCGQWKEMRKGGVGTFSKEQFLADWDKFCRESAVGDRLHLVIGDVVETVPRFVDERSAPAIAMLYLDLDLYKPTLVALECLYPLVVPGGIVVFDEYGYRDFPGETQAVNEYFHGHEIHLQRFPWAYCPSAYLVKHTVG